MQITFVQRAPYGTRYAKDVFNEHVGKKMKLSAFGSNGLCTLTKVDVPDSGSYAEITIDIDDTWVGEMIRSAARISFTLSSLDGD